MDPDTGVWNLAKWRFLQQARLWLLGNRFLEMTVLVGVMMWIYFEFFASSGGSLKYVALLIVFLSISEIRARLSLYEGYFDGYERGFGDAATRKCDYWGEIHDEADDKRAISAAINEIAENESKISPTNVESRNSEIQMGFGKLVGFVLTWRKLRDTNA